MMTDRRQADGSASPFAVPNDGLARFPEMFGGLVDRLGTPAFHPALRSALYQI